MKGWFHWGFILMCASLAYSILTFVYQAAKSRTIAALTNCVGCIQVLALLVWIVIGSILRFSTAGKACSGDYYDGSDAAEPYMWQTG